MATADLLTWASGLFLLGLAGYVVATVGLLWAALHLGRRLDRVIRLLEHARDQESD